MDKKREKKPKILFALPLGIGVLCALLSLLGALERPELNLYDLFLRLKPGVQEDSSIVLLDVDEESVVRTGSWPWPRGLMARGMEVLTELGASRAVFDIEYLEKSPMSVDREYLERGLRTEFDGVFDDVSSNIGSLFSALGSGNIPLRAAGDYGSQLVELVGKDKDDLYRKARKVAIENDSYLGRAMRLFGGASVTLNLQPQRISTTDPAARADFERRFAYPRIETRAPVGTKAVDFLQPIPEIATMAEDAGFTNVTIDPDGVRRRIRLVEEIDGCRYLQLGFAPLVEKLGNPEVIVDRSAVTLAGAVLNGKKETIRIPLDVSGQMLIRWPKKHYAESFRHVSFYRLLEYRNNEDALVANLRALRAIEAWALVPGANPVDAPLSAWTAAEEARTKALDTGTQEDRRAWLSAKAEFRAATDTLLAAGWNTKIPAALAESRKAAPAGERHLYDELGTRFETLWGNCAQAESLVTAEARELRGRLAGAFCIIGWTATATTDMGATPFDPSFVNVGTHAAVVNTILQGDFLTPVPDWVASLIALALSIGIILVISRLPTRGQIIVGIGATIAVFGASYAAFHFTGTYIPTIAPAVATFLAFLGYTLASFLISEREKSFLRKAFGTYLSGEVINQIIADPSLLKLGGQKRWMTAMFTDIRGFSTVSEQLSPEQLVSLLNRYLTGMSDIILQEHGTIDKYEGDAIISFFGAPLDYAAHARAACTAAIRMKQKEAELNVRFLEEKLAPSPLVTRIGLNTGDMVVGNMGTERKMDYTIMGNAVNLAARLEGVNKQYGSWILASDATRQEAGPDFLARRFDRVRVVGIKAPVQLWEILGLTAEATPEFLDFLDRFEKAHAVFDARGWREAAGLFETLAAERPDDGPSAAYLRRSRALMDKPPAEDWDGVFSLTEK